MKNIPPRPMTVRRPRRLAAVPMLVLATALCISAWARDHTAAVSPPITLAADQARAVGFVLDVRPQAPAPLFLFTDPNKDPDDLSVPVLAAELAEQGVISLRGRPRIPLALHPCYREVVANACPGSGAWESDDGRRPQICLLPLRRYRVDRFGGLL